MISTRKSYRGWAISFDGSQYTAKFQNHELTAWNRVEIERKIDAWFPVSLAPCDRVRD